MKATAKDTVEFSRPLLVNRVPRKGSHEVFAADTKECSALAKRFAIPTLHSLKAHLIATPWRGGGLKVTGDIEADLEQVSVISLEPFRSKPHFKVERFFLPEKMIVDAAEDDVDPIENEQVDLGELVAEAVALELDPYPKKPDEDFGDHIEDDTVVMELKPSPFAKLQKIVENNG
jgi:uncharacterized metal-binding protein YceD (DUF177 family)